MKKQIWISLILITLVLKTSFLLGNNFLETLRVNNLWNKNQPLHLHLGCGECHLNGYINIDFPPSEHTVQVNRAADIFADITDLLIPAQILDEVRSHHIFEHFNRQQALALLCSWHHSLKVGGLLVVETPDFDASIRVISTPQYNYEQKQITIRHIFGSHEASWAMHYDGWYEEKFRHVLQMLGFEILSIEKGGSTFIPNVTIRAYKKSHVDHTSLSQKAKNILRESMVDQSSCEEKMWRVWCSEFDLALKKLIG